VDRLVAGSRPSPPSFGLRGSYALRFVEGRIRGKKRVSAIEIRVFDR